MTYKPNLLSASLLLILFMSLLVGCGSLIRPGEPLQAKAPYFIPPTPVKAVGSGQPGPGASAAIENKPGSVNLPTPTVQCKDNLVFVKDITIPDGTVVAPDSTLDKRWQLENNGNCNWGQGYRIRLITGPELGAPKEQALYPARSGSQAVVRIVFKAPLEPGTYRSAWQAFNPQGEPFGDPFFIEIKVGSS